MDAQPLVQRRRRRAWSWAWIEGNLGSSARLRCRLSWTRPSNQDQNEPGLRSRLLQPRFLARLHPSHPNSLLPQTCGLHRLGRDHDHQRRGQHGLQPAKSFRHQPGGYSLSLTPSLSLSLCPYLSILLHCLLLLSSSCKMNMSGFGWMSLLLLF
jgi:hypothetical protein